MNLRILTGAVALVAVTAVATHTLSSQDKTAKAMDKAAMEALWMESGMPTAPHRDMARSVGKWNVATRWWHEPNGEPQTGTATAEIKMIMDGRFMLERFTSHSEEMPFEGQLILGYNNASQEYESAWIDSMGTAIHYSHGRKDEQGVLHLEGITKDIMTPEGRKVRMTASEEGENRNVFRMYNTGPDGQEFVVMENVYTK